MLQPGHADTTNTSATPAIVSQMRPADVSLCASGSSSAAPIARKMPANTPSPAPNASPETSTKEPTMARPGAPASTYNQPRAV